MMSIDRQDFKRSRQEEEPIVNKKRRIDNEEDGEFQQNIYKAYVRSALDALDNNNSIQIDTLANQISLPKSNPESINSTNLTIILSFLTNNISKLDSKLCNNLILSIISYNKWWLLPTREIFIFKNFIITLCSYLPKWWNEILINLIKNFSLSVSETNYHHELLKILVEIIPTSIHMIHEILIKNFPNKHNSKTQLLNYVSNLLILNDYCEDLRFNIWSLIIERCIQIDVELQNELDELDDDSDLEFDDDEDDDDEENDDDNEHTDDNEEVDDKLTSAQDNRKVHFDDDDEDEDEEDDDMSDDDFEEDINLQLATTNITDLSEKLDSILLLVLNKFKDLKSSNDEVFEENSIFLYNALTSLFKSHILPTYYTKSTQFILFYFTQQLPEFMDSFLVTLIDLSFSSKETIEKRIKSLQYLSSYLSRAKNLTKSQIVFVLSYLISWLNKYVEEREIEINGSINMDRFKLFYSTFQVLLYVFCFRHSLLKNENSEWELNLDKFFQRILITKFNPLKFINENVVLMFAKISQEENVAYCFSIIQKNKNERLKGISGTRSINDLDMAGAANNSNTKNNSLQSTLAKQQFLDLEGYFPFDPLFLKKSKKFLKDYYIEWSSISKDFDSDSDDFDDLADDAKEVVRFKASN